MGFVQWGDFIGTADLGFSEASVMEYGLLAVYPLQFALEVFSETQCEVVCL